MIEEKPITWEDIEAACEEIQTGKFRPLSKVGHIKCYDEKGRRCKDPLEKHMELIDRIIRA